MKRIIFGVLVVGAILSVLLIGCSEQTPQVTAPEQAITPTQAPMLGKVAGGQYIEGSYIVVLKDVIPDIDTELTGLLQRLGINADFRYRHALKGFAGKLPPALVELLRRDPRVAYIEQDQIATISVDQANPPSWGLDRIDQRTLPLSSSYRYDVTGGGVDAYIIDTGIRTTHNDFGGRAIAGYDAITSGGSATDGNGHGTHVAGTVGGALYGVAKSVSLIAVRVLNNNGSGSYSQVIAGVDWVTGHHTNRPAVANMSLGGSTSTALDDAVRRSIADGITYCIAAGNSTRDASTQSPARVVEALTVGATSNTDAFASFSNYGSLVDILAPGVDITSAWYTSNTATNTISGTSMASPHVAGAAALYLQSNSGASPSQVADAIVNNATLNTIARLRSGTPNKLLFTVAGSPPPANQLPAPTLVSPSNGSSNISRTPTLTWNSVAQATSYRLQVSTSSSFTSTVYDQSGITQTSAALPQLGSFRRYYWRVNATGANGTSPWSATWNFRTRW